MTSTLSPAEEREFVGLARQVLQQGAPPRFEHLSVSDIRGDDYQRDLRQSMVERIVKEYDVHRMQPIEVSRRSDGTLWCLDGQHRLAAARRLGLNVVGAMVHTGLSRTDEALLFWLFQRDRRPLNTWDAFKARLQGHERVASEIDEVCRQLGLRYGPNGSNHDIYAVATMERIHKRGGADLLRQTLRIIPEVWPLASRRFDGIIIDALSMILHQYRREPLFDRARLVAILSTQPPSALIARAREQSGVASQSSISQSSYAARVIHDLYNRRLAPAKRLPALQGRSGKRLPNR